MRILVSLLVVFVCRGLQQQQQFGGYDLRRLGGIVSELVERSVAGRSLPKDADKRDQDARLEVLRAVAAMKKFEVIDSWCKKLEIGAPCPLSAIDGAWRVSYSNSPPPSNGFGIEGAARQVVDVARRSYVNELQLPFLSAKLSATFEQIEPGTLRVSFKNIATSLAGLFQYTFDFPPGVERTWRLTYADEAFRIVRAAKDGGDEYLFVLTRDAGNAEKVKNELLDAISDGSKSGRISQLIDLLAVTSPPRDVGALLDASYRVLWTTEAELNAFSRRPSCAGAFQTIHGSVLRNLIDFKDGAFLSVTSSCTPPPNDDNDNRVRFEFEACRAGLGNGFQFSLPPVGSGYFDVVYIDKDLRVSKDSRGDLQVAERRPLSSPHSTISIF